MKILQVIPYFPPAFSFGGPVIGVHLISKELVRRGHKVVVFTTDAKDINSRLDVPFMRVVDGVLVYTFKNISMFFVKHSKLFVTPEFCSWIKNVVKSFDIVHLHEFRTFQNIIASYYAKKYAIPYVLQANGSCPIIGRAFRKYLFDIFFGYSILKNASKLIALNYTELFHYLHMGVSINKIVIIPSALDFSEFEVLPPQGAFKLKYGIEKDSKIILYMGRIHRLKGLDLLIRAFILLQKNYKFHDVFLVIAGPFEDDIFAKELYFLIKKYNLDKRVIFTGPLFGNDKLAAYVDADVFVLPSRYELLSRSVREAYACGKPVVAFNVGGLRDLIVDGVTGILVEPFDINQLASALYYLLSNDIAKEMGLNAVKYVRNTFSIELIVNKLEKLYEMCSNKR